MQITHFYACTIRLRILRKSLRCLPKKSQSHAEIGVRRLISLDFIFIGVTIQSAEHYSNFGCSRKSP